MGNDRTRNVERECLVRRRYLLDCRFEDRVRIPRTDVGINDKARNKFLFELRKYNLKPVPFRGGPQAF